MREAEFWSLVEQCGWGTKTVNDQALGAMLKKALTPQQAEEFCVHFENSMEKLLLAIYQWQDDFQAFPIGDDGMMDLVSHVIGLGREEFNRTLRDPKIAYNRACAPSGSPESYAECFGYVMIWLRHGLPGFVGSAG